MSRQIHEGPPRLAAASGSGGRRRRPACAPRGNALLYTLLALVLGGIGLAIGISHYQEAERAATVQATVGEITAIVGATQQNFSQHSYIGLTTAVAVRSQVIPATLTSGQNATTATNKFGGRILLLDNNALTPGTAQLTYHAIPGDICASLVNGTQSLARRIQVGSGEVKPLDGVVSLTALATQCNAPDGVHIVWTIGRI